LETIRELIKSEGTAAVYVTHDLAVVSEIATRVAVMYDGLIVEEAPTRAVLSQAAHPYTKRLVLSTPSVTRRRELVGIPGKPLNPKERPTGCPFAARCTYVEPRCMDDLPALEVVDVDHRSRCLRSRFVRSDTTLSGLRSGSSWDGTAETGEAKAQPLLTLAGVYASYGQDPVLHEVDLSISEGECLALVGESGSGKTTLARCVIGIHPDTVEGYIGFGGSSLPWPAKSRAAAARREIQYIFQNPQGSLNPRHTIGEIVAEPLLTFDIADSAGERRARVRDLLSRVALPADYQYRYPNQLSGGERQRVAIARALAAQPRLLVCDEITSSLDVSIQASILELLGQLRNQSNLTILFITHNLGIVRAIADEIVILEHGVIVERGPAERTLDAPAHPYTRELLANTPVMADVGAES
jgi:peptide/nickel transport system ATP-binding protein